MNDKAPGKSPLEELFNQLFPDVRFVDFDTLNRENEEEGEEE